MVISINQNFYEDPDVIYEIKNYDKGKSTFVNALLGLDGDEGAVETGVMETTMKAIRCSHPTMPNVKIWDLPGIGTPNLKAKKYLKEVKFETYDFFIIIGMVRFKENNIMLAKEIQKMKKIFYFVREEDLLSKIRQNCEENLKTVGNPKVFLISTIELGKSTLIQSLLVCSIVMIEKKRKYLFKTAFAAAAGASTTAAVPIPGFSVGCEIGVMQAFFHKAFITFGLDEKSLQRLSERVNKPVGELSSAMKSHFTGGVDEKVVARMMHTTAMVAAKAIEAVLTTVVFSFGAMGIAFATTLHLLHKGIKEMVEDAKAEMPNSGRVPLLACLFLNILLVFVSSNFQLLNCL
uniref:Immunity-related GTPase family, e4 n=1 Tax=Salmo trutta TaxID=8032 RepID=A0A674BA34_SALTR